MSVIEVSLPNGLLRDLRYFVEKNDIDIDSFVLWAVAEKMGELKYVIVSEALRERLGKLDPLIQRYPTIKKIIAHENFILTS